MGLKQLVQRRGKETPRSTPGSREVRLKQLVRRCERCVPAVLYDPITYCLFRAYALMWALSDWRIPVKPGEIPVPAALLRYRVHGAFDRDSFLDVGRKCAIDLKNSLSLIGRNLQDFNNVLEFGCGCGRVLRFLYDLPERCHISGTDIDREAIEWCRSNLPRFSFAVNNPFPPLPYPTGSFDLVYAISVFTHLDEDYQFAWLTELKRVLKPGRILIATTHGAFAREWDSRKGLLSLVELETLQRKGFLFSTVRKGLFKLDGLPDFYQRAYHTKQYVTETWTKFFTIRRYVERGMRDSQDLVLLSNE
jgi:SAM-dependent methyltransferase